jgi:hypothetical protein
MSQRGFLVTCTRGLRLKMDFVPRRFCRTKPSGNLKHAEFERGSVGSRENGPPAP